MGDTLQRRAKLFMNGRSQAVCLPKEFQFEGEEVRVCSHGNGILLEPVVSQVGAGNLERVAMKTDPEFAALVDVALQRLDVDGKSK